ncbi:MAG: hypothetical protein JWR80_8521 [Bradyrhizobium sp.]|nr:hypothetical protein [Bradyrhizobium sp.]
MSHASADIQKQKQAVLAAMKQVALAALEQRGYEVRGKTTTQIRMALSRRPTRPVRAAS